MDAPTSDAPPRAARWRPSRVHVLLAVVVASGLLLAVGPVRHLPVAATGTLVPRWVLLVLFLAGEALVVHVPTARGAHTFTFREVPTAIALLSATPDDLVLASAVSCALWLAVKERQRGTKLVFNLGSCLLDACTAVLVQHLLLAGHAADGPRAWAAVLVAVTTAAVVSAALVTLVIALDTGDFETSVVREALTAGPVGSAACASLAVLVVVLLQQRPSALPALAVVLLVLFAASRAHARLAARVARTEALHRFVGSIGSSLDLATTVAEVLAGARKVLLAERAVLSLGVASPGAAQAAVPGAGDDGPGPWASLRTAEMTEGDAAPRWLADGVAALAATRPWWARAHAGGSVLLAAGDAAPAGGTMAVPLPGDRLAGVLAVEGRPFADRPFGRQELQLLEAVAGHAAAALQGCELVDRLRGEAAARAHDASHDPLTGLANRHGLEPALRELCAGRGALLALGLEGVDDVAETLGQAASDAVLREVADRLSASGLPVGHLDGHHFAVLLAGVTADDVAQHTDALLHLLHAAPVGVEGAQLRVSATAGAALVPDHGRAPERLLAHASAARRAAQRGGQRLGVHRPADEHELRRRLLLAADMEPALADGSIAPWFQPKVSPDGRVLGVEALVRWTHPLHGAVPAEDVVALAERTGSTGRLTERVLEQALAQQRAWALRGADLHVAVNATMADLHDTAFADLVARRLARTGVDARHLTVEITEGSVMDDPERCLQVLRALADLGVVLSVDDFGTGHSSLAYLERLPVREVKIDRSFVTRLSQPGAPDTVVRATVELGHALGLQVVAEGVESAEVAALLADLGVDVLQGYHFGRPQPAEALTAQWWGASAGALPGPRQR